MNLNIVKQKVNHNHLEGENNQPLDRTLAVLIFFIV